MKIIQESISIRVQSLTACRILEMDGESRVRLSIVAEQHSLIATRTALCYLPEDKAKSFTHFTKDLATFQEPCTGTLISVWA